MDNRIKVWSYWHSEERPALVNECMASWKRHLDGDKFEIIVLSDDDLHKYLPSGWLEQIPDFKSLGRAMQSDFIRLSLLKFYGGVWLDASIYLLQDLTFIESFDKFYAPRLPYVDHSNVQTWFLVAPKDDYNINKWLDLFANVLRDKIQLKRSWYRLNMYSGLGLRGLILMDEKFKTFFKVYEVYISLYCNDTVFRENTPEPDEYGLRASFRKENLLKILKSIGILQLSKFVIYITNSTNAKDPLKLRQRVVDIMTKAQQPSVTLNRNGEVIFYKLNAADRQQLAPDFQFEKQYR